MAKPQGTLTGAQHEILDAIWEGPAAGMTVTEIWQAITKRRGVTRTTVLNQVDRLVKRGWLRRTKGESGFCFLATLTRDQAAQGLVEQFVDSFFGGSASELIMSLLGSKKLSSAEIARLRDLFESRSSNRKTKK